MKTAPLWIATIVALGLFSFANAQTLPPIYQNGFGKVEPDLSMLPVGANADWCVKLASGSTVCTGDMTIYPYTYLDDAIGANWGLATSTLSGNFLFCFSLQGGGGCSPANIPVTFSNGVVTSINGITGTWSRSSSASQFSGINFGAIQATTTLLFQYPYSFNSGTNTPYTLLYLTSGTGTIPWESIATTSGLYSQDYCANVGQGGVSVFGFNPTLGLCQVFAFLFVPQPSAVAQFAGLSSELATRFPFSWFYSVPPALQSLSASSTESFVDWRINFAAVDPATSTQMGGILPDVAVLSTTTVSAYLTDSKRNLLRNLMAAALWLTLISDVFFYVKHRMIPV